MLGKRCNFNSLNQPHLDSKSIHSYEPSLNKGIKIFNKYKQIILLLTWDLEEVKQSDHVWTTIPMSFKQQMEQIKFTENRWVQTPVQAKAPNLTQLLEISRTRRNFAPLFQSISNK